MPRRRRLDAPETWHHVVNRGAAKRTVFLGRAEVRYFLSRLAREVRRGEIELSAFCFLTTHFHLLVKSKTGHLADAMRRTENPFVRWFNRRQRRDGPLFRARFTSRRVDTEAYRQNVHRYIDENPVKAGLAKRPTDYRYGSARIYQRRDAPIWFTYDALRPSKPEPDRAWTAEADWVVERRLERPTEQLDDLDDLLRLAPRAIQAWMRRKALLADGTSPGSCLVSPSALRAALASSRNGDPEWLISPGGRRKDGWRTLEVGLAKEYAGLSASETAIALEISRSAAGRAVIEHRQMVLKCADYRERAAAVLCRSLDLTFGSRQRDG